LNQAKDFKQIEGEMLRKTDDKKKLKKYWFALVGKELYTFKSVNEHKHKTMHSLVGVFLKVGPAEKLDDSTMLYPITLSFPNAKVRDYYLLSEDERNSWVAAIKSVIGYSNLHDFYKFGATLG
jgi:hypothetical protein